MSPVLSYKSTTGFPIRRRAPFSSASLFPVCPERSPNRRTAELAPFSGLGSIVPEITPSQGGSAFTFVPISLSGPRQPSSCGDPHCRQDFRKDAVFAVQDAVPGTARPAVCDTLRETTAPLV